jgi:predicted  nucleic acid-binding Zn-ribbon protein
MAKQPIEQNPTRYKKKEDKWVISALPEEPTKEQIAIIKPLELEVGKPIDKDKLVPLLAVNGIVVKLNDFYIISEQTLSDIKDSQNPHYDIIENGKVLEVSIGKTVPIIEISDKQLEAIGDTRDIANKNAGVLEVDYIYETELEMGIPIGLINQINYTLSPDISRPSDKFKTLDWALQSERNPTVYDLSQLKIDTSQDKSKALDTKKMETFLKGVESGLKIIRKDFDDIKQCFMDAVLPGLSSTTWDLVATTDTSNDTSEKPQTISKTSTIVSVGDTPVVAKETALKKEQDEIKTEAERAKTTLEEKIGRQSDEFRRAQAGDTEAQDRLREEIAAARSATSDVYSKYEALSKKTK